MTRRSTLAVAVLTLALVAGNVWVSHAQIDPDTIERVIARTVLLSILTPVPGQEGQARITGTCSGSFVTATGLILTASHCVRATEDDAQAGIHKGQLFHPNGLLGVSLNLPDRPRPVLTLLARLVEDHPTLDLALVKVVGLIGQGGAQPLPADFRVPFVTIGNAAAVRIGEPVAVVGFPNVGQDTVTVNQGHVSGFTADDQNLRFQMKVDAEAGRGSSGGPVITGRGEQVAVYVSVILDPKAIARSGRATLTTRIPSTWAQYMSGAAVPGPNQPTPPPQPGPGCAAFPGVTTSTPCALVQGRIVDGATGAGVGGAALYVIKPGVASQQATRDDVIASAVSDANGVFQTRPAVPRGFRYGVVILANGYVRVDATLTLAPTGPDATSVGTVQMQRIQ